MDRVKGKVVIVTGAAGPLGKSQALLLAKEGARVVLGDIAEAEAKKAVEEIGREGGEAIFVRHDVTSEQEWADVIRQTLSAFGRLDVLVNNAGILINKAIEEMTLEDWRRVMAVNLDGVFLGTKHAMGAMKRSGGGSIVNISSVAGLVGMGGGSSAYSASKGGVRLFTKAAALQCSKAGHGYNIRVNSVHPAFILTPMMEGLFRAEAERTGRSYEETRKLREDWTMVGRLGKPEDVAYAVLYLASDESSFVTGAELVVDGGFTAR
jgi:NAD(P)-dependent dehydrogenase (short-subunit alcohol dehydrogenase family)